MYLELLEATLRELTRERPWVTLLMDHAFRRPVALLQCGADLNYMACAADGFIFFAQRPLRAAHAAVRRWIAGDYLDDDEELLADFTLNETLDGWERESCLFADLNDADRFAAWLAGVAAALDAHA